MGGLARRAHMISTLRDKDEVMIQNDTVGILRNPVRQL